MSRIDALRSDLGGPHPQAAIKIRDYLPPRIQAFIRNSPFAVMASADAEGNCDASPKGGLPGFIKVLDERTLLIPDIGGNRLFQSYHNFESNPRAALIFMIPGTESTVRVNGRVQIVDAHDLAGRGIVPELHEADDNSGLIQGLTLSVDEAYFHCPRAFKFAALWDTDVIRANARRSLEDLD